MEQYKKENPRYNDNYFDAYAARVRNNHYSIIELAEELTKRGYECYVNKYDYESKCTHLMRVIKNGKSVLCGFSEVPYRWHVGYLVKYVTGWELPLEIEEIEERCVGKIEKGYDKVFSCLIGKNEDYE